MASVRKDLIHVHILDVVERVAYGCELCLGFQVVRRVLAILEVGGDLFGVDHRFHEGRDVLGLEAFRLNHRAMIRYVTKRCRGNRDKRHDACDEYDDLGAEGYATGLLAHGVVELALGERGLLPWNKVERRNKGLARHVVGERGRKNDEGFINEAYEQTCHHLRGYEVEYACGEELVPKRCRYFVAQTSPVEEVGKHRSHEAAHEREDENRKQGRSQLFKPAALC